MWFNIQMEIMLSGVLVKILSHLLRRYEFWENNLWQLKMTNCLTLGSVLVEFEPRQEQEQLWSISTHFRPFGHSNVRWFHVICWLTLFYMQYCSTSYFSGLVQYDLVWLWFLEDLDFIKIVHAPTSNFMHWWI